MFKLAWRYMTGNKFRSLFSVLGVVLSVALILGTGILNGTMVKDLENTLMNSSGRSDVNVLKNDGFKKDEIDWLKTIKNVSTLSESYTFTVPVNSSDSDDKYLDIKGIDIDSEKKIKEYTLASGTFFTGTSENNRECIVSSYVLGKLNIKLGSDIEVNTASGVKKYKVVGVLTNKGAGYKSFNYQVFVPIRAIQNDMTLAGFVNRVDIKVDGSDERIEEISENIRNKFGNMVDVNNFASEFQLAKDDMATMKLGFNIVILVIIFIGCFLIYNTFSVVVLERIRSIGILKTIGMDKKNVRNIFLFEGLLLGIAGTLIGILLGVVLGKVFMLIVGSNDEAGSIFSPIAIPVTSLVTAILSGLIIPLVSSYIPARKASKYTPIVALKVDCTSFYNKSKKKNRFLSKIRTIAGIFFLAIDIIAGFFFNGQVKGDFAYILMPFQFGFMIGAIILLLPAFIDLISAIISPIFKMIFGYEGLIASRNLIRNKNRTAVILLVTIIGITMTIGFNGLFSSFRSSVSAFVDKTYNYDIYIEGGIDKYKSGESIISNINKIKEVETSTVIWAENIPDEMTGLNCRVLGIIPDEYRRTSQFDLINGKEEEIFNSFNSKEESCVIGSYLSEIYGIGIGDFYTINVNNQKFKFKVVGIVKSFTQDGRVIFLNKNNMEKVFGKKIFTAVFVKAKPESDIKNLKKEIREIFPDKITNILYVTEIRDSWKEDIVSGTQMFDAINLMILCIALLGLINTLIMTVNERKRELGMLRSIGSNKGQIIKMIFAESLALVIGGTIFGVLGGIAFTRYATIGMASALRLNVDIYYPIQMIVLMVGVSAVLSIISAVYPSIVAANKNIAEVIKGE